MQIIEWKITIRKHKSNKVMMSIFLPGAYVNEFIDIRQHIAFVPQVLRVIVRLSSRKVNLQKLVCQLDTHLQFEYFESSIPQTVR